MLDGALIAVRLGLYASLTLGFGLAVFALGRAGPPPGLRPVLGVAFAAGLLCSVLWLVVSAAAISGGAPEAEAIGALLAAPGMGTAWLVRTAALALALALTRVGGRRALQAIVAASGVALGSLAWIGHGAAGEGSSGALHLGGDLLHLLASGVWVGALAGLLLLLWRGAAPAAHAALRDFSAVGTTVVALLTATGLLNAWRLVGLAGVPALGRSVYGQLLLAKLALFGFMLLLAAANRWRLTPAYGRAIAAGDDPAAVGALRCSLVLEAGAALVILALVAWLGTLEPPAR